MNLIHCQNKLELGRRAAAEAGTRIRAAIEARGHANIIVATGASQFETLARLIATPEIQWPRVVVFHLDEYLGIPADHPASFRRYLQERFVGRLRLSAFHAIDGQADPIAECRRLGDAIRQHPIDLALVGIGENGHLAFNDPPADFDTDEPYRVVELDDACRRQQAGEGWFPTLDDVPRQAISMSCRQILASAAIVASVPDQRKAAAVRDTVEGPVTPNVPASILQKHPQTTIYIDPPAGSLLKAH